MALDPRTPVLVGAGQVNNRTDEGDPEREPVDLLAHALTRAAADADAPKLLAAADSVRVVSILSWRYRDPGALVADRVGASLRHTAYTNMGGNTPQALLNRTFLDVAAGRADVVLVGGAEAWRTRMAWRTDGERPPWTRQPDDLAPTEVVGDELNMSHPAELALGIGAPVQVYPMFETALRAAAQREPAEHHRRIAQLWAAFSAVAADNPDAWIRQRYTAEEIGTPGPENRMIGYPYPKLMNANNAVEQAAGLIVCSVEAAERFGVPRDRWVFPHSGADSADATFVSNRADLLSSPAIRTAGQAVLDLAGIDADDLVHIDLYSCFPSAVEVAATELGLAVDDPDRPLTVTGGLSFAGGPWSNYVTHAVATMVRRLRDDPGAFGLCTGNGGLLTKHSLGVYSANPPMAGFRWVDTASEASRATTPVEAAAEYAGPATVEAYTVMHDRDGQPERLMTAVRTPDGQRAWGASSDPGACRQAIDEELVGHTVTLDGEGTLDV
ncbi:MAG: acetyl-CoA acetyltransferase [Acidimicrobiales bacterium]